MTNIMNLRILWLSILKTMVRKILSGQDVGCDVFYSTAVCCLCTMSPIFDAEVDAILTDFETGSQDNLSCQTQYGPIRMIRNEKAICVSLLEEEMHAENEVSRQDTGEEHLWKE